MGRYVCESTLSLGCSPKMPSSMGLPPVRTFLLTALALGQLCLPQLVFYPFSVAAPPPSWSWVDRMLCKCCGLAPQGPLPTPPHTSLLPEGQPSGAQPWVHSGPLAHTAGPTVPGGYLPLKEAQGDGTAISAVFYDSPGQLPPRGPRKNCKVRGSVPSAG